MTEKQCAMLADYILTAGLDARIIAIERGDRFCLRLTNPCWFIWSFDDWSMFCKERKKERNQQRKAERRELVRGIDTREAYMLSVPALT